MNVNEKQIHFIWGQMYIQYEFFISHLVANMLIYVIIFVDF